MKNSTTKDEIKSFTQQVVEQALLLSLKAVHSKFSAPFGFVSDVNALNLALIEEKLVDLITEQTFQNL